MAGKQDDQRDAIAVLVHDHREVEEMFDELERLRGSDPERRKKLVEQVTIELIRHSVAEEQYLYPAVRQYLEGGDQEADHEIEEHAKAERVMKDLEGLDAEDPRFDELVAQLIGDVRHHIEEEEGSTFPKLSTAASSEELVKLGAKLEMAKKVAPTRPHPSAPDTPPWNKIVGPGTGLVDRLRDALTGRGK